MPGKVVEVRTEPDADRYCQCVSYPVGGLVPSPVAGVADLDVASLLAGIRG